MNFQEMYTKGDIVWYVKLNDLTGNKALVSGKVRSIYPEVLIITDVDDCSSHVIAMAEIDQLFPDEKSAQEYFNSVKIVGKYGGKSE